MSVFKAFISNQPLSFCISKVSLQVLIFPYAMMSALSQRFPRRVMSSSPHTDIWGYKSLKLTFISFPCHEGAHNGRVISYQSETFLTDFRMSDSKFFWNRILLIVATSQQFHIFDCSSSSSKSDLKSISERLYSPSISFLHSSSFFFVWSLISSGEHEIGNGIFGIVFSSSDGNSIQ